LHLAWSHAQNICQRRPLSIKCYANNTKTQLSARNDDFRFHIDHDISKLRLVAPSAKLFTFVREPVEHFLSGFKECEYRQKPEDIFLPRKSGAAARSEKNSEKYGPEKIRAWVKRVTTCFQYRGEEWNEGLPAAQQLPDAECKCTSHSYVQAASLPSSMDFVGDLSPENMEKFFRQEALPWGDSVRDRHDKGKIKHDIQLDKETLLAVVLFCILS